MELENLPPVSVRRGATRFNSPVPTMIHHTRSRFRSSSGKTTQVTIGLLSISRVYRLSVSISSSQPRSRHKMQPSQSSNGISNFAMYLSRITHFVVDSSDDRPNSSCAALHLTNPESHSPFKLIVHDSFTSLQVSASALFTGWNAPHGSGVFRSFGSS